MFGYSHLHGRQHSNPADRIGTPHFLSYVLTTALVEQERESPGETLTKLVVSVVVYSSQRGQDPKSNLGKPLPWLGNVSRL